MPKPQTKGKCVKCGEETTEQNRFTDDPEDTYGYPDWCHEECYQGLWDSL